MNWIRRFDQIEANDVEHVGGKGLSLGLMTKAGLPVPPGFCLTSAAYRHAKADAAAIAADLVPSLLQAYAELGGGPVAVRSSATVEDGEAASFAGQQETILGVEGPENLTQAVGRCWDSLDSERAKAYRRKQNVDESVVAMAVVIQRMVPAEVAGVLFTRDPLDPTGLKMMVEAAWGLGEGVVSGRVTPDRFHIDRDTGRLRDQHISLKNIMITSAGQQPVPAERQAAACLGEEQLKQLADMGRRIEQYYGDARDIEWAWADGRFWALQARPITTAGAFEREQVRREEIAALRTKAEPRGTVWAKYNLAEILPAPTPMTWAIVRQFMSGKGGYGLMLRDLGYDPDPIIDSEGFIDLVCSRPYVNLSREPKLFFRDLPVGHSFAALKANPEKAFYPTAQPDPERMTARFLFRLPLFLWQTFRNQRRLKQGSLRCADHLRFNVFPEFLAEVQAERQADLAKLSPPELLDRLGHWVTRTLNTFACESLQPTIYLGFAMEQLQQALTKPLGAERAAAAVRELLAGIHPDPEADLPAALQALQSGQISREHFLDRFGHRGPGEMELAQPRWAEAAEGLSLTPNPSAPPKRGEKSAATADQWQTLAAEAKLSPGQSRRLEKMFHDAQTYSALRETSKHYLMMGYALIRRVLVELGRRFDLGDGIFYLQPDELPQLAAGQFLGQIVKRRQQQRSLALSLEVPPVLFSDDLDAIGRPPTPRADGAQQLKGTPVSPGVVEAAALVLTEPTAAADIADGFILVCPSTDPAWVPLFLRAKGLVMETGGVLSHGAIVAREFGLPAVVGIAGVHQRLRTGQPLRVDGNTGVVHVGQA